MNSLSNLRFTVLPHQQLSARQRDRILSLCSQAYEEDFSPYLDLLAEATHLLAETDGELVSHAAWLPRELRTEGLAPLRAAYVEAVATAPDRKGKGYGRAVLSAIPAILGNDYDIAALSPSEPDYYARLGWELWLGDLSYQATEGKVATPEEDVMIYRLLKTPNNLDISAPLETDWRQGEVW
ncbi:GNAT family N-acetyltransferase [Chromobacterium sp. IIBBL 290-4]|uniref:GNAT family N-acetyltransferase n=1 Tax=Chromobacterium sp. IIBBL 290-4 TaxID=2953890 RepID=UPI0020B7FE07|nr:GNAT family N-acetyltransferase [Chromobacterium sp. IIBBL 290-4]UTH76004.1 GNAT family N-acetyltransferase [Chromobacterium sp. IIBBL 290-4]